MAISIIFIQGEEIENPSTETESTDLQLVAEYRIGGFTRGPADEIPIDLKNNNVVESLIQWHSIASLLFIVAAIYLVSFFVLNPYLSIFISIIISIVLLYFLEKRRLLAWLNFSIV